MIRASNFFFFLTLFYTLFTTSFLFANQEEKEKKEDFLLRADYISRTDQTIHLKGNVQIIFDTYHFSANEAFMYLDKKLLEGKGNVRFVGMGTEMGGKHLILNYKTYLGILFEGYIHRTNLFLKGKKIKRLSETKYLIHQGTYTSCSTCPADWSVRGSKVIMETNKDIHIYDAKLKVASLPILYLPFIRFPSSFKRRTGFLTPSFNFSQQSGWVLEQDFFLAISRNKDMTLGLKHYEHRGLKSLMEYRYVLSEESYGQGNLAFLKDHLFAKDYNKSAFGKEKNQNKPQEQDKNSISRWLAHYSNYYKFHGRNIYRFEGYLVSDLLYPRDFYDELSFYGKSALESRTSFTHNWDDMHLNINSSYYFNLLQSNPLSSNQFSVHRMPEIQYTLNKKPLWKSPFFFRFNFNYTHFWGNGMNHSDIISKKVDGKELYFLNNTCNEERFDSNPKCKYKEDSIFNPQDIARSGHRFLMTPQVSRDFRLSHFLHLFTTLDYNTAQYLFPDPMESHAYRHWLNSRLKLQTRFHGIFGKSVQPAFRLKHEIVPSISWKNIPWAEQSHHSFFSKGDEAIPFFQREAITDEDISSNYKLQFDYKDRLYGKNIYFFNLDNIFTLKTWKDGKPIYKQVARLHLSQSYNNYEKTINRKKNQNWSDLNMILETSWNYFESYTNARYYPYYSVSDVFSRLRFIYHKNYLQLSTIHSYPLGENRSIPYSSRLEDYTLSANLHTYYIDLAGALTYDANFQKKGEVHRVKSWSYYFIVKPPGRCWDFSFKYEKITEGDINWKFHFNFNFDQQAV